MTATSRDFRITVRYERPAHVVSKNLRKYIQGSLFKLGLWWHKKRLPRHFTWQGAKDYHYSIRSKKYMDRKRFKNYKGEILRRVESVPLVFTGKLREMTTSYAKIRSTSKSLQVTMKTPYYLRFRGKGGTGPDMRRELLFISDEEAQLIAVATMKYIKAKVEQDRTKETKRIL